MEVKIKVRPISTSNMSQTVADRANINNAIKYNVLHSLSIDIFTFDLSTI